MHRLKNIYISNNRISKIDTHLEQNLPNLQCILLNNNAIEELADLDVLATVKTLKTLSLIGNPVTKKINYRAYVAAKIPSLRLLDFRRITKKEREEGAALFGKRKNEFVPGDGLEAFRKKQKTEHDEKIKVILFKYLKWIGSLV